MLTRMTMTKTFCAEWLSGSVVVVELGSVIDQCHECKGPGGHHNSTPTVPPYPPPLPLPLGKSELIRGGADDDDSAIISLAGSTNTHDDLAKGQTHWNATLMKVKNPSSTLISKDPNERK